jgi:hypothetical protein
MTWVMGSSKQMVSLHSAHIADMCLHSPRTGDHNIEKDGGMVTWLMKVGLQEDGALRYIIDRKNETSSRSRREVETWLTFEFTLSPRSSRDAEFASLWERTNPTDFECRCVRCKSSKIVDWLDLVAAQTKDLIVKEGALFARVSWTSQEVVLCNKCWNRKHPGEEDEVAA